MNYYIAAFKKYAEFTGRVGRAEYWYFVLFTIIVSVILSVLGTMIGALGFLSPLYALAALVPSLAVGARRLHDIGKSGWIQLIVLIPLIGAIWLIVLLATEGNPGGNAYGPGANATPVV